jgi:hypothetical protein
MLNDIPLICLQFIVCIGEDISILLIKSSICLLSSTGMFFLNFISLGLVSKPLLISMLSFKLFTYLF